MEDLLYYIGLGLFIVFSLIRKAGKAAAQKSKKGENMPTEAPMENFPPIIPTYTYKSREDCQPPQVKKYEQNIDLNTSGEAQSLETIFDEEDLYLKEQTKRFQAAQKAQKKANNSANTKNTQATTKSPNRQNKGNISDNNTVSEEFNLREAVIYAEILKPKFEE